MYINSIDAFVSHVENDFQNAVLKVLEDTASSHVDDAERRSWEESLPELAKVLRGLPAEVRAGCQIALEAKYESEERADAVLAGICRGRPVLLIIENKRWSDLERYRPDGECCLWDPHHGQMIDHPARQVERYKTTLEYTNQFVQDSKAEIRTLVFLQNATLEEKREKAGPFAEKYRDLYARTPMFTGEEAAAGAPSDVAAPLPGRRPVPGRRGPPAGSPGAGPGGPGPIL